MHPRILLLLLALQPAFCALGQVALSEPVILVPSRHLPPALIPDRSNNNVDVVRFHQRFYVSFRSAPYHFPSGKAAIYIISSPDLQHWKLEHRIQTGNDLREPRFLVMHDQLLHYCFEGGHTIYEFDPRHIWLSQPGPDETWSDEILPGMDGFVPWRLKMHHDLALLSAYWGKDLYGNHQGELRLFQSADGKLWTPLSKHPQVAVTGAEEGEFEFDPDGNLWACVRVEGQGALVCHASKDSLHTWQTFRSRSKYDSSCMFRHKDDIYLLARRNRDGSAEKAPRWLPESIIRAYNLTRYSFTPKTTALYRLNKSTHDFDHIIDLPGCGDNAFPAITQVDDNTYLVFNYSNSFDQPDRSWFSGQFAPTFIYYLELRFTD